MKNRLVMVVASFLSFAAFAEDEKTCRAECKEFVAECQAVCDSQLKKKDPKAQAACRKNCENAVKDCEEECQNG